MREYGIVFTVLVCLIGLSCARPVADFVLAPESDMVAPGTVFFENISKKADTYSWDLGDGTTSTRTNPVHEYEVSGNYPVTLIAKRNERADTMLQRVVIDAPTACLIEISTPHGDMLAKLHGGTPKHRDNFTKLVELGFYDSLLFHRVIEFFMIQGGDPNSKDLRPGMQLGTGGPGYDLPAEIVDTLIHRKGALAAARMPDESNPEKRSSGSQFYIVHGTRLKEEDLKNTEFEKNIRYSKRQRELYLTYGGSPSLDREYTIFGQVIDGLDVLDKIAAQQTGPNDRPVKDIPMTIRIIK